MNTYLQVKTDGQRVHRVTQWATLQLHTKVLFVCFLFLLLNYFLFSVGWLQGQRAEVRGQGNEWDWDAKCEIHKESIKKILFDKK